MEQIFRSLLQKQGYEYIGLVNSDKGIWGYAKDGVFHFCKEDLTEVDRYTTGFDSGVIVLTLDGDNIIQVNESTKFHNFRVIDDSNNILSSKNNGLPERIERNHSSFYLKRINEQSIIIVTWWDKYVCKPSNKALYDTTLVQNPLNTIEWDYHQVIVIDSKFEPNLNIYMFLNGYYFFKLYDELFCEYRKIYYEQSFVYEGRIPYVWLHEDGKFHLIRYCEEYKGGYKSLDVIDLENINFPKHIEITKYAGRDDVRLDDSNTNLCSNYHVVIPFSDESGSLIIQYYQWITAYCIHFELNSGKPTMLKGNLIRVVHEHTISECSEINYYDINGNHLEIPDKARFMTPFAIRNKSLFNKIEKLYGVIDLRSEEIVLPPIFKSIKEIDYNDDGWIYEVKFCDFANDRIERFEGVYSSKKGFVSLNTY